MNSKDDIILFHTNYFGRPWTWVRRGAIVIVFCLAIIGKVEHEIWKPVLISAVVLYYAVKQKEDVAISQENFFYKKRSLVPRFNTVEKFPLNCIISFRCGGFHTDGWELVDVFNGGGNMGGHSNRIEMTFKDGSSKRLDVVISRNHLDRIASIVYKVKGNNTRTLARA